jgi:hypothetical protein
VHPLSHRLADCYINTFAAANRSIRWTAVEQEKALWLNEQTLLVGRVDGEGETEEGQRFFVEQKTASASKKRYIDREKREWRTNAQALTYGVLVPDTRRFTVRWAFKPTVDRQGREGEVSCDFEWYSYTDSEVDWWRNELLRLADRIRVLRSSGLGNWQTNFNNCLRYGEKYECPFYEHGCSKLNFDFVPPGMQKRYPENCHLERERSIRLAITDPNVVIIDATRTELFIDCQERYRKLYEIQGLHEDGEALTIGKDFHTLIAEHLKGLMHDVQTH